MQDMHHAIGSKLVALIKLTLGRFYSYNDNSMKCTRLEYMPYLHYKSFLYFFHHQICLRISKRIGLWDDKTTIRLQILPPIKQSKRLSTEVQRWKVALLVLQDNQVLFCVGFLHNQIEPCWQKHQRDFLEKTRTKGINFVW